MPLTPTCLQRNEPNDSCAHFSEINFFLKCHADAALRAFCSIRLRRPTLTGAKWLLNDHTQEIRGAHSFDALRPLWGSLLSKKGLKIDCDHYKRRLVFFFSLTLPWSLSLSHTQAHRLKIFFFFVIPRSETSRKSRGKISCLNNRCRRRYLSACFGVFKSCSEKPSAEHSASLSLVF